MVFTLPIEFSGAEEEVAQMCLGPKEAMLKKPEESTQHLKPLYVQSDSTRSQSLGSSSTAVLSSP
jgi:hypothetical protein